jgi:hypothetical protein
MDSQQPQQLILREGRIPQAEKNETAKKMELLFLQSLNSVDNNTPSSKKIAAEEVRDSPSIAKFQDCVKQDSVSNDSNWNVSQERIDDLQNEEFSQVNSKKEILDNLNGSQSLLVTPKEINVGERKLSIHDNDEHSSMNTSEMVTSGERGGEIELKKPTPPSHPSRSAAPYKNDDGEQRKKSFSNPFPYYSLKRTTTSKNQLQTRTPPTRRTMTTALTNASNQLEKEIGIRSTTPDCGGVGTVTMKESYPTHSTVNIKSSEQAATSEASNINWDDWDEDLTFILMDQRKGLQGRDSGASILQQREGLSMVELCGVEPDPNFLHDDWDASI